MQFIQRIMKHTDLLVGIGLLIVVGMLIMPLPTWFLDLGLVIALASSVLILLASVNIEEPVKFSIFPSLLLITTLFRLALSIAATKHILGSGEAGAVITAFGTFVMGGDFVVGFISFLILMIVQFMVITNGAGRVSEVVARFTLDAMPGKQMAIDADLAAGLIDEEGARKRRKDVKQEADFYGSMDGASKFVKGDAIASLMIIAINIIGGFVVGFMRNEGGPLEIMSKYALLSVGEGLVSQLPALLISTASGLLVTRSGQEQGMGGEVFKQVAGQQKAIMSAGGALCLLGFLPGFPTIIFVGVGIGMIILSRFLNSNKDAVSKFYETSTENQQSAKIAADAEAEANAGPPPYAPEAVLPLLNIDSLEIEIGYGLTRLADKRVGGDLSERITATRRQIAVDLGFVMPSVRIRDAVSVANEVYVIKVRGEEVARAESRPDQLLAINSGQVIQPVPGTPTIEPVFQLEALWIDPAIRDTAERMGYTVIEPGAVIATHLSEVVKQYAAELLTRQEVNQLVENIRATNSALLEDITSNQIHVGDIQKVLQHLLRERVPIRDIVIILETMVDFAGRVKDMEQMGELVRSSISRTITRQYVDQDNKLFCLTFDPVLERALSEGVAQTAGGAVLSMEPEVQTTVVSQIREEINRGMALGTQPIVLCSTVLRLPLKRTLDRHLPQVHVLAYNEVAARADVEFVGQIKLEPGYAASVA